MKEKRTMKSNDTFTKGSVTLVYDKRAYFDFWEVYYDAKKNCN